jgi:hypothetical protein
MSNYAGHVHVSTPAKPPQHTTRSWPPGLAQVSRRSPTHISPPSLGLPLLFLYLPSCDRWAKLEASVKGGVVVYIILLPRSIAGGDAVNEKVAIGRPAKIAPLKPPKEIDTQTCPQCAMKQIQIDRLKA